MLFVSHILKKDLLLRNCIMFPIHCNYLVQEAVGLPHPIVLINV